MNLTLALWLLLFVVLAVAALRRPAWGVALYMLTFFLAPPFWWWGGPIQSIRWNLYASLIMLTSLVINGTLTSSDPRVRVVNRRFLTIALLMGVNATLVHFLLAPSMAISSGNYELLLKVLVLFAIMIYSIRTESDLKIIVVAIVLGATYIGYEVTINDRGSISGGRLEGVGAASASTSNDLACLMVACIPFVAPLFLFGFRRDKALAVIAGPFILNVVLLCNSRGALLGIVILGIIYLTAAPPAIRLKVYKITALGLLAGWLLLGDPRIVDRFLTTFASEEEMDNSAMSRLEFWKAGLLMIADYPLGTGGHSFRDVYGSKYIAKVTDKNIDQRKSVHNGYLNEACQWGVQGLLLRLMLFGSGVLLAWITARRATENQQYFIACTALSTVAGLVGLAVQSVFGTFLDNEWGIWLIAISIGCHRLVQEFSPVAVVELPRHGEDLAHDADRSSAPLTVG